MSVSKRGHIIDTNEKACRRPNEEMTIEEIDKSDGIQRVAATEREEIGTGLGRSMHPFIWLLAVTVSSL